MSIRRYVCLLLAASAFAQDLDSPDIKERVKAVRGYRNASPDAIPTLQPRLDDAEPEVRLETVRSLVSIGTQYSLDPLVKAAGDNDPAVQIAAADGLVNFYVPGYVQTGMGRLSATLRGRFDRENRDIVDPWITVRPDVITALGKLTRGGASMESRANAARAVGILRGKEAVPDLLEALQTKDTAVLFEVLIALQKIGDKSAGPRVITLLRDLVERVQVAAIETVGILRTSEANPDLQRAFDSAKSSRVRTAALTSMAMLPDPKNRPWFDRGFQDKDDKIRAAAAEGYGRLKQESDAPTLRTAFDEEKKMLPRLGIAFALVSIGDHKREQFSPLTYLVNTLNTKSYREVAEIYLRELTREPAIRAEVHQFIANATGQEKMGLARVLALTGDTESLKQLEWISKDSNPEVAAEGLSAVKSLRSRLN